MVGGPARVLALLASIGLGLSPCPLAAQLRGLELSAQVTALGTRASPAVHGETVTEAYLTQPILHARWASPDGGLAATGMLNLEGWTLERGELNAGVWGEGYVDRRHPHTFLHELAATAATSFRGFDASLSAGRGFPPFGTDDPMVRPFVKYPANHHLAQILERWFATVALRRGPVILEAGAFNGDEPIGPASLGEFGRFGDSWSLRATVLPLTGLALQASRAYLDSPEHAQGRGLDQRKWSTSARYSAVVGASRVYALLEWARTDDYTDGRQVFAFGSWLAEGSVAHARWLVAARWERSTRPEEERLFDPFRTARPHADENIIGATRWITLTGRLERSFTAATVTFTPFVEASHSTTTEITGAIFSPVDFYGDDELWTLSLGTRIRAGERHDRMGRYGVAVAPGESHQH